MNWRRLPSSKLSVGLPMLVLLMGQIFVLAQAPKSKNSLTLDEYRSQLASLERIVESCRKSMDAAHCESGQVGPDVEVALPSGVRVVRYGWLRDLLNDAAKAPIQIDHKDTSKGDPETSLGERRGKKPADDAPEDLDPVDLTVAQRLDAARFRLEEDARAASEKMLSSPQSGELARSSAHATLNRILAQKEYKSAVAGRSLKDRILEKIGNWIDTAISKLAQAGARSKWIGTTAEIGFVTLLCVAVVWFLIRLERQGRLSSELFRPGAGSDAVSARDWQLWLQDAREAAASKNWREAIHFLYWASISRLESSGQWAPDKARTPREYLALLGPESSQSIMLTALTRSFERTWYAGLTAVEQDFRHAEQLAGRLGAQ